MKSDYGVPIDVKGLSCLRRRNGSEVVHVLDNLSFHVPAGSILTIVGPSGCGKTTLLNVICGLLHSGEQGVELSGKVLVGGDSPTAARLDRRFGYCFQKPGLLPWKNVTQNVELPLLLAGATKSERSERIPFLLETVRLHGVSRVNVSQLSGGMQHRVALARSLALAPPVLLMDEPFAAVDEPLREDLNVELLRLWQELKSTILFVTHSLSDAILLGSRVLVLSAQPACLRMLLEIDLPNRNPDVITTARFAEYLRQVREQVGRKHE